VNTLHQEDLSDMSDLHDTRRDREISLGTSTILLLFFAIALVCSGFFGFGYSLGRKSAQPVAATSADASSSTSEAFRLFKTAPKTPAGQAVTAAPSDSTDSPAVKAAQSAPVKVAAASKPVFDPDASVQRSERRPRRRRL
jgi:DedD protein